MTSMAYAPWPAKLRLRSFALLAALLALGLTPGAWRATAADPIAIDALFETPGIFGTEPRAPAWSADGQQLAFSWARPGEAQRRLWLVGAGGEGLRPISAQASASLREFVWLGNDTLLLLRGASLWQINIASGNEERLAEPGGRAYALQLAPDGRHASYLRDGDLWLLNLQTRKETAATDVGLPPLSVPPTARYSRPEREIGPGIWGGPTYAWAPDSRRIVVHLVDRRGMRTVPFPNYLADETDPNPVRRGYPGDPNEARRVGIVTLGEEGAVALATPQLLALDDADSHQIVAFSWSPSGSLLIDVASDTNTLRRLYLVADDGPELLWENRRDSRIYTRFGSGWTKDGEDVLLLSDHENFYGLYRLDTSGERRLTRIDSGAHDVLGMAHAVSGGSIFFEATAGKPAESHVFRRSDADTEPQQLTAAPGHHRAIPSPRGNSLAILSSDDNSPLELYLTTDDGQSTMRITHSPSPAFDTFPRARVRYLQTPATGGRPPLHMRLLLPADFDDTRAYPVLFGPMYSNTVRNRWGAAYTLMQQALTQRGYLVVQVDVRGSTGYGRAFREAFLNDFAGGDIEDIEDAVDYLSELPYVDRERLGIWGSSYGGTLSVYTLLKKPGLFAAAVAAASAVDPRFFGTDDVAIVRRPGDGSGIFERRAADLVDNLEDALLLVHGMQDQVVPFKTVATLADDFIRAGKPIEMLFLPGATHGWRSEPPYDRYVFARMVEFFDRHLKDAPTRPASTQALEPR